MKVVTGLHESTSERRPIRRKGLPTGSTFDRFAAGAGKEKWDVVCLYWSQLATAAYLGFASAIVGELTAISLSGVRPGLSGCAMCLHRDL